MKAPVMKAPFVFDRLGQKASKRRERVAEKRREREEAIIAARARGYWIDDGILSTSSKWLFPLLWTLLAITVLANVLQLFGVYLTMNNALNEGSIKSTYSVVLNREAKKEEVTRWQHQNNVNVEYLAKDLKESDEYKKLNISDEEKKQDDAKLTELSVKEKAQNP